MGSSSSLTKEETAEVLKVELEMTKDHLSNL